MNGGGKLDRRVAFDAPTSAPNGQGGTISGWAQQLQVWANFRFLRGGEVVQSARLEGRQPVVVTIRASTAAKLITPEWRMRDTRTGTIYAIRTCPPPGRDGFVELTCESGVVP
jgi:SPP1 family predicted phage head-tail adaptor